MLTKTTINPLVWYSVYRSLPMAQVPFGLLEIKVYNLQYYAEIAGYRGKISNRKYKTVEKAQASAERWYKKRMMLFISEVST